MRDVIVGELFGRVDPDDLDQLIQTDYYPMYSNNTKVFYREENRTRNQVIYRIEYPPFKSTNHPERIMELTKLWFVKEKGT